MLNLIEVTNKQKELRIGRGKAEQIKKIEFKNVTFNYEDANTDILKNFSCVIKGGKINGIIGKSGSGKTTLVNMIPRLIEPSKGNIFINNINLKNIDVKKTKKYLCIHRAKSRVLLEVE